MQLLQAGNHLFLSLLIQLLHTGCHEAFVVCGMLKSPLTQRSAALTNFGKGWALS